MDAAGDPGSSRSLQLCNNCESSVSSFWCLDCNGTLCNDCELAHRRVTLTKFHRLRNQPQPGAEMPPSSVNAFQMCRLHLSERLELYCFPCAQFTCKDCQLTNHRSHSFEFVNKATAKVKKQLGICAQPIRAQEVTLCQSLQDIESRLLHIQVNKSHLKNDLLRFLVNLVQGLKKKMAEIFREVLDSLKAEADLLNQRKEKLMQLQQNRQSLTVAVERSQNLYNLQTLLSFKTEVESQVREMLSQDLAPPPTMSHIRVCVLCDTFQAIKNLAKVEVSWIPFSVSPTPNQSKDSSAAPPSGMTPPSSLPGTVAVPCEVQAATSIQADAPVPHGRPGAAQRYDRSSGTTSSSSSSSSSSSTNLNKQSNQVTQLPRSLELQPTSTSSSSSSLRVSPSCFINSVSRDSVLKQLSLPTPKSLSNYFPTLTSHIHDPPLHPSISTPNSTHQQTFPELQPPSVPNKVLAPSTAQPQIIPLSSLGVATQSGQSSTLPLPSKIQLVQPNNLALPTKPVGKLTGSKNFLPIGQPNLSVIEKLPGELKEQASVRSTGASVRSKGASVRSKGASVRSKGGAIPAPSAGAMLDDGSKSVTLDTPCGPALLQQTLKNVCSSGNFYSISEQAVKVWMDSGVLLQPAPDAKAADKLEEPSSTIPEVTDEAQSGDVPPVRGRRQLSTVIGPQLVSLTHWQPTVSLFRLPVAPPTPGQPLPRFRVQLGETDDQTVLQEIQSDRFGMHPLTEDDVADDAYKDISDDVSDDVPDFTEPLSSPESDMSMEIISCSVCISTGSLIICDFCARGYHPECHVPPTGPHTTLGWTCSLCQDLSHPPDPYSSDRICSDQSSGLGVLDQRKCDVLLLYLKVEGCVRLTEFTGWSHLEVISERLASRRLPAYQSAAQFISDVWTVFKDASWDDALKKLQLCFQNKVEKTFGPDLLSSVLSVFPETSRHLASGSVFGSGSRSRPECRVNVKVFQKRLKDLVHLSSPKKKKKTSH